MAGKSIVLKIIAVCLSIVTLIVLVFAGMFFYALKVDNCEQKSQTFQMIDPSTGTPIGIWEGRWRPGGCEYLTVAAQEDGLMVAGAPQIWRSENELLKVSGD